MRSSLPKVLHSLGGKPLLQHIVDSAERLKPDRIHIVVGYKKDLIVDSLSRALGMNRRSTADKINWVNQVEQKGTGHAANLAVQQIEDKSTVIVLNGDTPLISSLTLLQTAKAGNCIRLVTATVQEPAGYGRVLRNEQGYIVGIVEEKDATLQQKSIKEVNSNCLGTTASCLKSWLACLDDTNAQKEYYLTDIIAQAVLDDIPVEGVSPVDISEVQGINDRADLSKLERIYQYRYAMEIIRNGVTLLDPDRFDLRGTFKYGSDCTIDINVILEGAVRVGNNVTIGSNTLIRNSIIGHRSVIQPNTVINNAVIGADCVIGPYAHIRPLTLVGDKTKIGNFIEIKKSRFGKSSRANHHAYIGDTTVGDNVNIGAGVITCNFDGANKHRTIIGDDVFIGSDSQLIAPVKIEAGATIGAGSTITSDVQNNALAVSRVKQLVVPEWKRPAKK